MKLFAYVSALCMAADFDDIMKRLSILETATETLEIDKLSIIMHYADLTKKVESLESENERLRVDVTALEAIARPGKVPANCDEHYARGEFEDGVYLIKPTLTCEPFKVHCEFSGPVAITTIHHDQTDYNVTSKMGEFDGCSQPGCFKDEVVYEAKMKEIVKLMSISETCEQEIVNICTGNPLSSYSWWVDRNGNKMEYWDGSHPKGTKGCKCSLDEDGPGCTKNPWGASPKCNCDIRGDRNRDDGVLTNKNQLPVTRLSYGASHGRFSWINYKLGFLKCKGKAAGVLYPSEASEDKLKHLESQIDELAVRAGDNENDITDLQMKEALAPKAPVVPAPVLPVPVLPAPVVAPVDYTPDFSFKYKADTTAIKAGEALVFANRESGNEFGAYDRSSGLFTAPSSGRYAFTVYLHIYGGSDAPFYYNIYMKRGDAIVGHSWTTATREKGVPVDSRKYNVEVEMEKGQTVSVFVDTAETGIHYDMASTIEGHLVEVF
jgi:hypothetical protein